MTSTRIPAAVFAAAAISLALPAAAQNPSGPNLQALQRACAADAQRLCANVQQGGGRVIACLKQNQDKLSNGCRQAAGLPPLPNGGSQQQSQPAGQWSTANGTAAPDPNTDNPSASAFTDAYPSAGASPAAPAPATPHAAPIDGKPQTIGHVTYVRRIIEDPEHGNMAVGSIHVPQGWTFTSKVQWHYDWIENPVTANLHANSADNTESYDLYPMLKLEWTQIPQQYQRFNKNPAHPGQPDGMGSIVMPPQPPLQALQRFVKTVRPNVANFKWVGTQDLPDLAHVLGLEAWPGDHGVAVKISYDLDGKSYEESFFGVYYSSTNSAQSQSVGNLHIDGNAFKQTNWGFRALQSFRAPTGYLDARMNEFCLIAKSFSPNPKWVQLGAQIHQQQTAAFNQKLQAGYDQLRAANATMQQVMAQEKSLSAQQQKFDQGLRAPAIDDSWLRDSGGSSGGGGQRSSADKFDDLVRGVDTVHDDSVQGGQTQLSNAGQYHFTDGFGNYRTSDDPNYTPEKAGESGDWHPMAPVD